MDPAPDSASAALSVTATRPLSRRAGDLPYMGMTIVAILLLLGSLWIF